MQPTPIAPVLHPAELAELLSTRPEIRLLDVRMPGEFEQVHIRGSYNVPLDQLAEHAREIGASVADPVVLVCQSGQRARRAEQALLQAGMPNLHVLDGGVTAWIAAGKPVVRGAARWSLERQVRLAAGVLGASGALLALFVSPLFAWLPALVGIGLAFAGATNRCGMALVLARLPYNRGATCDVRQMVDALRVGDGPSLGGGGAPAPMRSAA